MTDIDRLLTWLRDESAVPCPLPRIRGMPVSPVFAIDLETLKDLERRLAEVTAERDALETEWDKTQEAYFAAADEAKAAVSRAEKAEAALRRIADRSGTIVEAKWEATQALKETKR